MGTVQPEGRVIYLTGQVAWDADKNIIGKGDVAEQTRQCFRNIEALLHEVGGTLDDLVSITTYFLDLNDLPKIQSVRNEFLSDRDPPVSTSVKVAGLGHEDFLVELTPIAVVSNNKESEAPPDNSSEAISTLIGNWEGLGTDDASRYFDFADAYVKASKDVCSRMKNNSNERTWPNASSSLMLAAHAVELFLKGALLTSGKMDSWGHSIDDLYDQYRESFPCKQYEFDCPFVTKYLGYSDEEIKGIKEQNHPQSSVIFRYPVNRPGTEWNKICSFDPESFSVELDGLTNRWADLRCRFCDL